MCSYKEDDSYVTVEVCEECGRKLDTVFMCPVCSHDEDEQNAEPRRV